MSRGSGRRTGADPKAFLPLTAVAFEILLALADGERYGYAIMQDIEESTAGATVLYPGTLYRAIDRLERSGLVREADVQPGDGEDQRRRYYALTSLGHQVVTAEAGRLARRVAAARAKSLLPALT